jgi:hypothetical protein
VSVETEIIDTAFFWTRINYVKCQLSGEFFLLTIILGTYVVLQVTKKFSSNTEKMTDYYALKSIYLHFTFLHRIRHQYHVGIFVAVLLHQFQYYVIVLFCVNVFSLLQFVEGRASVYCSFHKWPWFSVALSST